MRRALDITVALGLLILSAPVVAIAAVLIMLESGSPVLFRQERVGRNGVPFVMLKLRTMYTNHAGPSLTAQADRRITKVGRWLRRMRLDEVPQLVNVLRGEMALVGPRPEVPKFVEMRPELYRPALAYRPGLTDPASVAFANEAELLAHSNRPEDDYLEHVVPAKLALSLSYARTATAWSDLLVLIRTGRVIIARNGEDNPS